jgi:membrane-bound ClpP family serine protease
VPLWQSPLGSVVGTLGKVMNLDAFGVNINDFVILLFGLAVIYAAFTYRNWELALIVYGVWLTIGTLLLGGSGKLMVPGISLALVGAALSYMLKREQQP